MIKHYNCLFCNLIQTQFITDFVGAFVFSWDLYLSWFGMQQNIQLQISLIDEALVFLIKDNGFKVSEFHQNTFFNVV